MRILKLRFANLNSLAGEWAIDFSHPAYGQGGLFAITGPTGVGKTTILDAVCLALYGQTPRLGRISKSANEIMTRHRAECFAEVVFETAAGRWRAHWSQHRSRKKADGELQAPRQEIVDDLNDKVLESSLQKTQAEIEKITGLDFGQFTRAMMLAQGAFAAFLNADAGERSNLLEKITGVAVYGEISLMVHDRRKEETDKLNDLEAELKSLSAPAESGEELARQKTELAAEAQALEKALAEYNAAAAWREKMAGLEKARADLAGEENDLRSRRREFEPLAERLREARRARPLDAPFGQLQLTRQRTDEAAGVLAKLQEQMPALEKAAAQAAAETKAAEEKLHQVKAEEAAALPVLRQVRDLELRMLENRKQFEERLAPYRALEADLEKQRRNRAAKTFDGLKALEGKLESEIKLLSALTDELEQLRVEREQGLIYKGLAEYRARLVPGRPCELCGSVHHPYADPAITPKTEISEEVWRKKNTERDLRQKNLTELTGQAAALRQYLASEAGAAAERLKRDEGLWREMKEILDRLRDEQMALRRERTAVFGESKVEAEEKRLSEAVVAAEKNLQRLQEQRLEIDRHLLRRKTSCEEAAKNLASLKEDLAARRESFGAALKRAALADEADYLKAALPPEQLIDLENKERDLNEGWSALLIRQNENSRYLEAERGKNISGLDLPELRSLIEEKKTKAANVQRSIGALDRRLEEWRKTEERRRQVEKLHEAQKKECAVWHKLHDLIGSHDGKKFRNYAQGLTFEAMISQANGQLAGLSDRYRLIRDPDQPLELLVADDYQAGEKRSTKNLSGGESFLVSLALALGLSKMASRRVRLDSLFLDEGFGALDEETLDQALETLAALQGDGKLIGVISHVPALKNRVATQIRVSSRGGPFSVISGPGVVAERY
ncbi:AAA family ATPase [Deltaproteobacteria bacterium OttesenSCG-928-M10]|nr:AAA family ATPase [Deltaproteobacteria bacterium OttesenSCG-928-M10]